MASSVRRLPMVLAALALAGCGTVIQPNLGPDTAKRDAYDATPTLPNAIAVGISMRDRYLDKIDGQIAWERGIGVGLIGATTIAADMAMRGVGRSEVLGLGLAGAALYTSSNWLFSKPQQLIYAAGASAVQCALDVTQPWHMAEAARPDLRAEVAQIRQGVTEIDQILAKRSGTPSPAEQAARAAVQRARELLPKTTEWFQAIDGAGAALRSSLMAIQLQVTDAYLANSPNLPGLVEQLGKSLPATGSKIVGVPLAPATVKTSAVKGQDELERKAEALDSLVTSVDRSLSSIDLTPDPARLKLCKVDLRQVGLALQHTPAGALAVRPGSAATVVVSGGALPYRAEWIGTRPPDSVALKIETGQGFVTVDAKPGTPSNKYKLLVLDAGAGRDMIDVVIGDGGGAAPSSPAPVVARTAGTASAPDPTVRKVQQRLMAEGITSVSIGGVSQPLSVDGRTGPVTFEAIRAYFRKQGSQENQIPKDNGKLLKDAISTFGIQ